MNPDNRPDPNELLAFIKQEDALEKRGKLKIFFGMSPGVGKTYSMLQTAQMDKSKGVDVVIGYVESHNRPETNALMEGLEIMPRKIIDYKNTPIEEMDLDAILKRHPYLVVVDELAHTNARGCRHNKRYQDVLELLDNGINVYTTVNIQHLESRTDTVAKITGVLVRETVPDEVFEIAAEVELIDVTPNTLLERLAEGKIYAPSQSKEAMNNFFRKGNITALREMALRLVADRVDKQLKTYMQQKRIQGPWKSGMHLLALIDAEKSSEKIIKWAKNLSYTMGADLLALYVEGIKPLSQIQQAQLSKNIELARQLGSEAIITSGRDFVSTALQFARKENITHIIIGKSDKGRILPTLSYNNPVTRLLQESGDIDVYVIEPGNENKGKRKKINPYPRFDSSFKEYIFSSIVVLFMTLACLPLSREIGYQSISFLLLFGVLCLSMFFQLGPVFLASTLSAVVWNFFFIPPTFTIKINKPEDLLAFFMFFIVALITGILTSRVRKQERLTRKREEKTMALFRFTNQLVTANSVKDIIEISKKNIKKYFLVDTYFILQDGNDFLKKKQSKNFSESEYSIAQWVFKHSKKAGKYTDTLSSSSYTFFPLKGSKNKIGVIVVKMNKAFDSETELFWNTFLLQIGNSLENIQLTNIANKVSLLDESDRLYKTLFNSISHELRIPVATIMGASDILLSNAYPDNVKSELYNEILKASKRLNQLIENLLNMSRVETGKIAVRPDWCDIRDLFNQVVGNLKEDIQPFKIDTVVPETMPLVKLDFGLMEQVLHNLVLNSCRYAPSGTTIRLKAFYDNDYLIIQEMDRGKGFSEDVLPFIFDRFYRAENEATGGLGLGLSIVKGFVQAHKGTIKVENRQNGGTCFTIKIPTEISYPDNLIHGIYG